jgi:L-cystine uptake protein TcyP (sodium:dicarboxylate symporter family)
MRPLGSTRHGLRAESRGWVRILGTLFVKFWSLAVQATVKTFRASLLDAAVDLQKAGKISRLDLFRLRLRLLMPSTLADIEAAATAEVMAQGLAPSAQQIDWDKLREFLMWFIPFLIELIGQFGEAE